MTDEARGSAANKGGAAGQQSGAGGDGEVGRGWSLGLAGMGRTWGRGGGRG